MHNMICTYTHMHPQRHQYTHEHDTCTCVHTRVGSPQDRVPHLLAPLYPQSCCPLTIRHHPRLLFFLVLPGTGGSPSPHRAGSWEHPTQAQADPPSRPAVFTSRLRSGHWDCQPLCISYAKACACPWERPPPPGQARWPGPASLAI